MFNFRQMDPGGIGALIGVSIMVCVAFSYCAYDNRTGILRRFRTCFSKNSHEHQSLLAVVKENPMLVRRESKQWKMKEIFVHK